MQHWFFLTDEEQKTLAFEMSVNSLANSLLLTSSNMTTPLGVVFDYWNNEEEVRAILLLETLKAKVADLGVLNQAANRLEMYLFAIQHLNGELIESFNQWLNQNGLQVVSLLSGIPD